jgi:S1-C subfamily serine protease
MVFQKASMFRLSLLAAVAAGAATAALILGGGHAVGASVGSVSSGVDAGVVDVSTRLSYEQETAAGTGIVVSRSGEVLTNNHVIRGATSIRVTDVGTGRSYGATVLGYSVSADVAVLKLKGASGLETASIGNSTRVRLGQGVTAVGNAGGVGGRPSVTTGHVTALHQSITVGNSPGGAQRLTGLIKSTAPVQPGDSGGPLLDAGAHVIGIVTAASPGFEFQSGGSSGFAIPINTATAIAKQIEAGRSSPSVHVGPTAFLGVLTRAGDSGGSVAGALIQAVVPGSAAAKAGLQPGDVITSFDGHAVPSPLALTTLVLRVPPGRKTELVWLDQLGNRHSASVRPQAGPPQ